MKNFKLIRNQDVTGISGTGYVAQGCEFDNGMVAITWLGKVHSITFYNSIMDAETIHCHAGATVIEWEPKPKELIEIIATRVMGWHKGKGGAIIGGKGYESSTHWYDAEGNQKVARVDDGFANLKAWYPTASDLNSK